MSFLAAERELALSDDIYRSVDAAGTSGVAAAAKIAAAPQRSVGSGGKKRICVAFYEAAQCPYNDRCEFGHHFSELNSFTQNKLLDTVPVEKIPGHFILPLDTQRGGRNDNNTNNDNDNNTEAEPCDKLHFRNAFSETRCARTRTGGHRRKEKMPNSHDGCDVNVALCENSASSLTSSIDSYFCFGSLYASNNASPHKNALSKENVDFRIRLPQRCRYPHRATQGTYYDVLGVQHSATQEEIIASYRRWQQDYKRLRQVNQRQADARDALVVEARNVLGHPVLRYEYDSTLPGSWGGNVGQNADSLLVLTLTSSENSSCSNNVDISKIAAAATRTKKSNGAQMCLTPSMSNGDAIRLAQTVRADESIW